MNAFTTDNGNGCSTASPPRPRQLLLISMTTTTRLTAKNNGYILGLILGLENASGPTDPKFYMLVHHFEIKKTCDRICRYEKLWSFDVGRA